MLTKQKQIALGSTFAICLLLMLFLSLPLKPATASGATGAYIVSVSPPNINVPHNWTPWSNTIRHAEIGRWEVRPRGGDCPFPGPCGYAYAQELRVNIEVGSGGYVSFDWWMRSTVDQAFDWVSIYLLNPVAPNTYRHVPIVVNYNPACPSGYVCDPVSSPVFHEVFDLTPYANKQVSLVFDVHYFPTLDPDARTQAMVDNLQIGPTPGSPYSFDGFTSPLLNVPALNDVEAGKALVAKFSLGGYQGPNIFGAGYPVSQPIDCATGEPLGSAGETVAWDFSDLFYKADTGLYVFSWKPDPAWAGTCRQLAMLLDDGTTHLVNFHFR